MEEDNKKERKSMKRSHNDAVRELVALCARGTSAWRPTKLKKPNGGWRRKSRTS